MTDLHQPEPEVIVKRSSQPAGGVGWEIRLVRVEGETDQAYLKRTLGIHQQLSHDLVESELVRKLEETIARLNKRQGS